MLTFTDDSLRTKIRQELGKNADGLAFLPFSDVRQSVVDDVKLLEENELLLDVPITGYVYDVKTGQIKKVS